MREWQSRSRIAQVAFVDSWNHLCWCALFAACPLVHPKHRYVAFSHLLLGTGWCSSIWLDLLQHLPRILCWCQGSLCLFCTRLCISAWDAQLFFCQMSQFPTQDVFGDASVIHTADMTKPTQSTLLQKCIHAWHAWTSEDVYILWLYRSMICQRSCVCTWDGRCSVSSRV